MNDTFLTWLNSPESFNDLRSCARLVIHRGDQLGITLDDSYMAGDDVQEYQTAVATNIWQFIREEAENLAVKGTRLLVEGDTKKFASFICREFIDSCVDQRRNDSPFHAYYRHMVTVLRENNTSGFSFNPVPRKCSYYAWSENPDLIFLPDDDDFRSANLNYTAWAASSISFSEIHHKSAMIAISRHFWDEALRIIVDEYFLPIRGLVMFVAVKYPLIPKIEYGFEAEVDGEDHQFSRSPGDRPIKPGASSGDDAWTRQLPILAQSIIEVDIEKIARDCVAELNHTEKLVLCELEGGLSQSQMAVKIGLSGSNFSNYKTSALKKLSTAWRLWSQPDSEHYSVAEDELRIFHKKVIEICKEANGCRDSWKEERS